MTQYIVSARKYRPETFDTLIGQDNIAQTLKNSIIRGQLAHAYLFCGPRGVGKTTTARIFAKAINCSDPTPEMEPCGHCESCLSFAEGRSYCIHELDAASNNGVEDIKALMDQVRIPPQVGKYSVYIIDEVHMLSQAAFNAFLKTLEEPPAHAIFILATTEKHKILPTILSRCQTYDFNRITVDNIVRQLRGIAEKEGVDIDDESLHVIANKADGAMRDALTIFDQTVAFCGTKVQYKDVLKNLNVLDYEYSFSLTDAFLAGDYPKAFLIFDEILAKGFNALHFVAALSSHFRDLTVSKSGGLNSLLELPESLKKRYKEQADRCSLKFLYDALAITTACESGYRSSINPRLHIEFALMKLSALSGTLFDKNEPAPKPAEKQPEPAAQSQAPAMAPEQEDPARAEQPVTRRTRQAKASVLSVKSMTEESGKKAVATEEVKQMPSAELTEETIREKWQELAKLYEKKPRLSSAISTAALECSEDKDMVTFRVFNTAQRDWIESKCLLELEGHFQRLTGSSIKLRVDVVAEEDTAPVAYMPSEKAQDLMNKNEEVKNLVKDLGLDIK
ncbi:MAG: DNA polymerase III subunit gamma/tau [Bacteroidetes bacterium]|uniref:DNA polymerase III subunit gamma/tau n=1 Tax=Candidatus Cryptobacteroides faecigallinarum TaxID=2840763 RepID=A0A9D9IKC9_9BACT|nr:DNA polymerase III subunit gamma/tau [Candidatus Cryptobacteroides faecigallinarum]